MNPKIKEKNKSEIINNCVKSMEYYLSGHIDFAGFIQKIIVSEGGPDRYAQIKIPISTTSRETIKSCIVRALYIAKAMNGTNKEVHGCGFPGFRIVFQITTDWSKYIELETVDYTKII